MKESMKTKLLKQALQIAENVSCQLDRAYIAHCNAAGIEPDKDKHDKEYSKKGF
jgi:hypothetical protein